MTIYGEVTNGDRADWALAAVKAFHEETRYYPFTPLSDGEVMEAAGDLLCNLMHLIRLRGFDYENAVQRAIAMHLEEMVSDD